MKKLIKKAVDKFTEHKMEKQLMNTLELPKPAHGQQNEDTENEFDVLNASSLYRQHKNFDEPERKFAAVDAKLDGKDAVDYDGKPIMKGNLQKVSEWRKPDINEKEIKTFEMEIDFPVEYES